MRKFMVVGAMALILALAACGGGGAKPQTTGSVEPAGDALPTGLFVTSRPAGEIALAEAKKNAKRGDTIVVRGVVRGVTSAFIAGRAIFMLADETVPKCPMNPDRPWDLHCETSASMAKNTATVQIAGADGKPLKRGLQGINGLDHMKPVVVKGTVTTADEKGNLVIDAIEIFVDTGKG